MEGEWLLRWAVSSGKNGHVTEVASLQEGEWSCYRGGQFNGRENGHVNLVSLMEEEWSCYGSGQ